MTTSRLKLYNSALLICEDRPLASLTEEREARRLLDAVWDDDGVKFCLQAGYWNHAMRAVQLTFSTSIEPAFGFRNAFDKPDDWVRTAGVCQDEFFNSPLLDYQDETNFIFADLDTIYCRYVSNDTSYGMDLSLWPPTFTNYVAHLFASRIVGKLSTNRELVEALNTPNNRMNRVQKALTDAKSKDAMDEATAFLPPGNWTRARHGRSPQDRGNRGRLIG